MSGVLRSVLRGHPRPRVPSFFIQMLKSTLYRIAMNKLDPGSVHAARVLWRLVRWKRWQRRRARELAERRRLRELHRLPDPKYWPGDPRPSTADKRHTYTLECALAECTREKRARGCSECIRRG